MDIAQPGFDAAALDLLLTRAEALAGPLPLTAEAREALVASADGDGASAEAVKAAIKALIDAEAPDDILSDDTLVDLLKEKGFDIARRTVAKYREAMGIGSSVQRRRAKKMGR